MAKESGSRKGRSRHPWKKLLRWLFRAGALFAILLLALLHLLPHITDTAFVKGAVAQFVSERLRGAAVRIETLRLAPLHKHLLLVEGVSVAPPEAPESPLVTIGSLDCRWLPGQLLHGRIHLTSVDVKSLHLRLALQDGRWNFLSVLTLSSEPFDVEILRLPVTLQIDRAVLTDGELEFAMENAVFAALSGFAAELSCSVHDLLQGRAVCRAHVAGVEAEVPYLSVRLPAGLDIELDAHGPNGLLNVAGAVVTDELRMSVADWGDVKPMAVGMGFQSAVDVQRLQAPQNEVSVQVPGLFSDTASFSLTGGPDYTLEGENALVIDLDGVLEMVPERVRDLVDAASLSGRIGVFTNFTSWIRMGSDIQAGFAADLRAFASGVSASVAARLPFAVAALADPDQESGAQEGTPLQVDVVDLDAHTEREFLLAWSGELGGTTAGREACSIASLDVRAGRLKAGVECVRAGVAGQLTVPLADFLALDASMESDGVHVEDATLGRLSVPVAVSAQLRAHDPLDAGSAGVVLQDAKMRLGDVVPAAWCRGQAKGYDPIRFGLLGAGEIDLASVVGLIHGLPEELRSLAGDLAGKGTVVAGARASGQIGLPANGIELDTVGAAEVSDLEVDRSPVQVSLAHAAVSGGLGLVTDNGFMPHDVDAHLQGLATGFQASFIVSGEQAAAGGSVAWNELAAHLRAGLSGADVSEVDVTAGARVKGFQAAMLLGDRAMAWEPLDCEFGGNATANPLAGDLAITSAMVRVADVAELHVPELSIAGFGGDAVSAQASVSVPDVGRVAELALSGLGDVMGGLPIPTVSGALEGELTIAGSLPLGEHLAYAIESGQAAAQVKLLPLAAFYEREMPLDAGGHLQVSDLSAFHSLDEGLEVGFTGLNAQVTAQMAGGDLTGRAEATLPSVTFAPAPIPLRGFRTTASFGIRDFNEFTIADAELAGLNEAVQLTGSLFVGGLGKLMRRPTLGGLLQKLDVGLSSSGSLRLGALPTPDAISADGDARWDVAVDLTGGDTLSVRLTPALASVSVGWGDLFDVQGVNGRAILRKEWRVGRSGEAAPAARALSWDVLADSWSRRREGPGATLTEFGTAADGLLPPDGWLTVDRVLALGKEVVRNAVLHLSIEGATLSVPRFHMESLGGRVMGTARLGRSPGGRRLEVRADFSGIDFRGMLPPGMRDFPGDSRIDGNAGLSVAVGADGADAQAVLRDVAARADVTRIGSRALDRLLTVIDPQAANPNFARLRKALLLGSPRQAAGELRRGFVTMSVEIQGLAGRLVREYAIPRFSVAGLFTAEPVARALQMMAPALSALDILDTRRLQVGEDGSVRPR